MVVRLVKIEKNCICAPFLETHHMKKRKTAQKQRVVTFRARSVGRSFLKRMVKIEVKIEVNINLVR